MELVLDRWPGKWLAAVIAVGIAGAFSLDIWKHLQADRLTREGTEQSLQRAIELEPRNGELYSRLGRKQLFSETGSASAAIASLERATQLDPRSGSYWVDLGQAREAAGDVQGAAREYARARDAEPRTPGVLWQEMNFDLRHEQSQKALETGRDLLAQAPPYTPRVLPALAEVTDLSALFQTVLPADESALTAALEFVCRRNEFSAAGVLWSRILALGDEPSSFYLRYFLDALINAGEGPLAARVWQDSIRRNWIAGDAAALEEPLYNGDFRRPLLGFGFDWRVAPQDDASVFLSDEGPQPGEPCLCADLADSARADFYHVSHPVLVEPGAHYLLRAKMRVRRLTSPGGAFLSVSGVGRSSVPPVTTSRVIGTTGWEEISTEYAAGPETRIARIFLVRPGVPATEAPANGQICLSGVEWKRLDVGDSALRPGAQGANR